MKSDTSLRTVEPLAVIKKHPGAATLGGVITALCFGAIGAAVDGGTVGVVMAVLGVIVGAPGGAHMAEATEVDRVP